MTVTRNITVVLEGDEAITPTAPLIEGSTPASYSTAVGGIGFNQNTSFTGRYGCRIALPSTTDFTTHDFVGFQLGSTSYAHPDRATDVDAGGYRFVFIDGSGNYSGFNVYGGDIPGFNAATVNAEGLFGIYQTEGGDTAPEWYIAVDRTPDIDNGTPADMSDIDYIEFSCDHASSASLELTLRRLSKISPYDVTGTEDFSDLASASSGGSSATRFYNFFARAPFKLQSASGLVYESKLGINIGDGSTTTTFSDSNFALGFQNTWESKDSFRTVGPLVQLNDANERLLVVNQSSSCELTLADGSISSAGGWQWSLQGSTSGAANLSRIRFIRCDDFECGHGVYVSCVWNDCDRVEVTSDTAISAGILRNSSVDGFVVIGSPSDYSALTALIENSNTGNQLTIEPTSAGTFDLRGISVESGHTLAVRNNSATHAITVQLQPGITVSTSTAGGGITIDNAVTYDLDLVIPSGVTGIFVIHDEDDADPQDLGTELQRNNSASGTQTYSYSSAKAADVISVSFWATSGGTYKRYQRNITLPANDSTLDLDLIPETN